VTARLPIRWRLTLWYAALLAAALALFGLALYLGLRHLLYEDFREQVERQSDFALAAVRLGPTGPTLDAATIASMQDDEHFVRLFDADGRIVVDTYQDDEDEDDDEPLVDPTLVAAALAGETRTTMQAGDDWPLRIVTRPVRSGDAIVGVLQVGMSREDADEVLRLVLVVLGIAAPLVLLLAAGGGYLLAGRALAPVAAITDLAGSIGGQDLHARLNLDLLDDELGRLAHTFDAMLARIEDAFERQRRFTGDAAHELRTPLSLMRSQVDLALVRLRSPREYQEALRGLDEDLERLTGLVNALLTLARADTGRMPLERAPMDLAETVSLSLEHYAPLAAEAGIDLVEESSPAPLVGDQDLLVQVLVNLLDNALAHTPSGGRIVAGCRREGERVRLWVADTGQGIVAEDQARVFDRFYRVDTGRAREQGGAGLGLAICKAIAEAHGGTIGLTSRVGAGTRVEVVLPASG
jgi:heavy metal sensor kinase